MGVRVSTGGAPVKKKRPKYMAAVERLLKDKVIKPGKLYDLTVLHDDWCAQLKGKGPCNCNPETVIREIKS